MTSQEQKNKSISHDKALLNDFKKKPAALLSYLNACIADEDFDRIKFAVNCMKKLGFNDLFGLMDELHFFN